FLVAYYISTHVEKEIVSVKAANEPRERRQQKQQKRAWMGLWTRRIEHLVPNRIESRIALDIIRAGGLDGLTPSELFFYVLITTILGGALATWVACTTSWSAWLIPFGIAVGAAYPFLWLRDKVKKRHGEIQRELPYHIDLLTLCVEAGLDFAAGVARTVEKGKSGALRNELSQFLAEVRVGKTRAEALEHMSVRVGLPALANFVSALIQAERLGVGLGKTLRAQAEQLRNERSERAEKAAGEAPVKILIPLVLFVFPTIWVILAAPIVFEWVFGGGG
ncbi:MAG: type II secretion system F family protein, partial [Clostridia bacterium]|nr:type II secretion system F family protein [Deltaproteobacteria bacterium]